MRGVSFLYAQRNARSACRSYLHPVGRFNNLGFRVVSPSFSDP
jgi:formylglycine-generating enzyme required for sulfatase activity